jgi:hypothetical protein
VSSRASGQPPDEEGRFIWTGRRFHTTPQDLARLWSMLPDGTDPAEVLVVLVPPERSADLPDSGILDFDATGANPAPTACYADAAFVAERFRFIEARREIRT